MVQWWECFPPTSSTTVNWVQILDLVSHVDWLCCWFLSLHQGVFCGSSSFPPLAKYQHSKFQLNLVKVDRKSHPTDCPLLISSYLLCVRVYCHPCRLRHVWDQSLYILSREGVGGFLLYHPEINLVPPPPSFFLFPPPPPPVINNDRCFTFNFPLSRKKQSHIVSPKNMSSTSRKWKTLFVFSCFFFFFTV